MDSLKLKSFGDMTRMFYCKTAKICEYLRSCVEFGNVLSAVFS